MKAATWLLTYSPLIILLIVSFFVLKKTLVNVENFDNYSLQQYSYSKDFQKNSSSNFLLLSDWFPVTNKKTVTANSYKDIWRKHPPTKLGNFSQTTNNLKHINHPDDGSTTPPEFSGSLYKSIETDTNHSLVLPLTHTMLNETGTSRINYYTSHENKLL